MDGQQGVEQGGLTEEVMTVMTGNDTPQPQSELGTPGATGCWGDALWSVTVRWFLCSDPTARTPG